MKILLLVLVSANVWAQELSLGGRVAAVYHECLPANQWKKEVKIQQRPTNYKKYYRAVSGTTWLENHFIMFAYPDLLWEEWKSTQASVLFHSVVEEAQEISRSENLSELQRVCLSQCISSRIIAADPSASVSFTNLGQLFESVPSTIEKGEATCRGFARVFFQVASLLNLNASLVASTNHIFNEVKTSEGTVHLEPRDPNCYLWR